LRCFLGATFTRPNPLNADSVSTMPTLRLTKRSIETIKPQGREFVVWDEELKGFGLRVQPSGSRSYVVQYRAGTGRKAPTRRYSIGKHGAPWTPTEARREAQRLLLAAATGNDPAVARADDKKAITVAELCELYLKEGCALKKASTLEVDHGRIRWHLVPLLGKKRVRDITRADGLALLSAVANGKTKTDVKTRQHGRARVTGGKYAANRAIGLFCAIMNFACDRGLVPYNPVQAIKKFPERKRERTLSSEEMAKLGQTISQIEKIGANPMAIAIIRLLMLTGARRSEVENLKWSEIDFENRYLRLDDSKTGQKKIPLSIAALEIFKAQKPFERSLYVFPACSGSGVFQGLSKVWHRIRFCAGLDDLRLHDLRHAFASVGVSNGVPLAVIGRILGHSDTRMTSRYAHLADDPVLRATDQVANLITAQIG
jgi:integrase